MCGAVGGCILGALGTVAPLAFMWRTERRSQATFQWRLAGEPDMAAPSSKAGSVCDAASGASRQGFE